MRRGAPVDADVAVAVNGVVAAVARTYRRPDANARVLGGAGQPGALHQGPQRRARLRDPLPTSRAPSPGVLVARAARAPQPGVSRGAEDFWAVTQSGFYPREGEPIPHRWTTGEGIAGRADRTRSSRRGRCESASRAYGAGGTPLTLTLNDCTLFTGRIDAAPWYHTFSLRACPARHSRAAARDDQREKPELGGSRLTSSTRGVAVETVNLFARRLAARTRPGARRRGRRSRL